ISAKAVVKLDQLAAENPQNVLGKLWEPGLRVLDDPFYARYREHLPAAAIRQDPDRDRERG
ncbi:hypothetical protein LZ186_17915, partial [Rhodovulum sulfidophilum]|uniref:hypothetical protein n=1 Tax=Rhodovulum sulfidophilum TaxID=35806 RepID=UPI001F2A9F65